MPLGEIKGSHGDMMIRAEAFRQVGGFDPEVFVGEDNELCVRLRKRGWILLRIDAEMSLHDMAMTRFGQWWRRTVRSGFGYMEGALLHGKPPERHYVRDVRSILFWGLALPLAILILAWPTRVRQLCPPERLFALVLADSAVRNETWVVRAGCTALRLLVHTGEVPYGRRPDHLLVPQAGPSPKRDHRIQRRQHSRCDLTGTSAGE